MEPASVTGGPVVQRGSSREERLAAGLEGLGVDASPTQRRQLLDFLALLAKWNATYNLTSVRDPDDMLAVHLLDSLSILHLVDRFDPSSLLDVGSGAGLPAIPLAILRPAITVHSIDAVAKKVGFQWQAKAALGLANLQPQHARIEATAFAPRPSVIVSRAFADIATMLANIEHVADEATTVIAMKAKTPTEELAALPSTWHVDMVETLDVPFLGAPRCAVVLKRNRVEAG